MAKTFDPKKASLSLATSMREAQAGEKIVELLVSEVEGDPRQRRTTFDTEALQEMSESIRVQGVIQPIIVRVHPKPHKNGKHMIVAGERRWRASKLAGVKKIPAVIREFSDEDLAKQWIIQLTENIQREGMTLRDQCSAVVDLQKEGMTNDEIATQLGKKKSWISKLSTIGKAGGSVAEAIEADLTRDGEALYSLNKLQKENPASADRLVRKSIDSGVPLNRKAIEAELDKDKHKDDGQDEGAGAKSGGAAAGARTSEPGAKGGEGSGGGSGKQTGAGESDEPKVSRAKPGQSAHEATPEVLDGITPASHFYQVLSAKRDGNRIILETDRGKIAFNDTLLSAIKAL